MAPASVQHFGPVIVVSSPSGFPKGFTIFLSAMHPMFFQQVVDAMAEPIAQPGTFANTNWEVFAVSRRVVNGFNSLGGVQIDHAVEFGVRNNGPHSSNFRFFFSTIGP